MALADGPSCRSGHRLAYFADRQRSVSGSTVRFMGGGTVSSPYQRYAAPHSRKVLSAIESTGVPRIHFGVNTGELLELIKGVGADVVGIDWRVQIDRARLRLGDTVALQGNLDPAAVIAGVDAATAGAREVLALNAGHPGHIFNLGHGVLPTSDPMYSARL